jgi:hypothetical protein
VSHLDHLAVRVASDPFFVASTLAGVGDAGLTDRLTYTGETLTRQRRCRTPLAGRRGRVQDR